MRNSQQLRSGDWQKLNWIRMGTTHVVSKQKGAWAFRCMAIDGVREAQKFGFLGELKYPKY